MKNLILLLLFSLFISCTEKEEPIPVNEMKNTTWEATDPIADMVVGGTNVQQYEFTSDTEVQFIKIRNGGVRSSEKGTYSWNKPTLTIMMGNDQRAFEISGSLMISGTQRTPSGGYLTFQKK
ncbi:hypothetical protein [Rhodonellum sp.]|uniref:hypothetical protein n=1 Tax=Rhodonellum sp. TaxID=2231180 RepID=UPI002719C87D|nr:hypothetical protein [Rhodonellum sp.]MDO9554548.1 hypothetical protein [Rhodonellum sp.]